MIQPNLTSKIVHEKEKRKKRKEKQGANHTATFTSRHCETYYLTTTAKFAKKEETRMMINAMHIPERDKSLPRPIAFVFSHRWTQPSKNIHSLPGHDGAVPGIIFPSMSETYATRTDESSVQNQKQNTVPKSGSGARGEEFFKRSKYH